MDLKEPASQLLKTKPHFEILDGLRGVAAFAVVIFHFMEFTVPDYNESFIAHAYLAVDFFFCLSGFVIAYAYDRKLPQLGAGRFFLLRLIRLHPLVVIGSVIGLIAFVFDPFSNLFAHYGWGKTITMFVASCLLIPYPLVHERYFNLFHLNPPTWSLFWEYIANIFYALVLYRLRRWMLAALLVLAAAALFHEAYQSHQLSVGWGGDNIMGGGVRVLYSFMAGMLVYRLNWIIRSRLGFITLSVLLMAAFLFPFSDKTAWIVDPLLVILYLPFLVALGAGATLSPRLAGFCKFSGNISYPLYMVHYPFLWLFMSYHDRFKPTLQQQEVIIPVAAGLLVAFAYVVMKYLDEPIRAWLTGKMIKERMPAKA